MSYYTQPPTDLSGVVAAIATKADISSVVAGLATKANLTAIRTILTADLTLYVRKDGNDNNNGLADTAAGAFLTIHKAAVVACAIYDLGVFNLTIQVRDGTYTETLIVTIAGVVGIGRLSIVGNVVTPTNVIVTKASGTVIDVTGSTGAQPVRLSNFRITPGTNGTGLVSQSAAQVEIDALDFAATSGGTHMKCDTGGQINPISNYTISGGAAVHADTRRGGFFTVGAITVTASGSPAFSAEFVFSTACGVLQSIGTTFTGTITGKRYSATQNGVINTNGGGANYFPGNSAGTTDGFGAYF